MFTNDVICMCFHRDDHRAQKKNPFCVAIFEGIVALGSHIVIAIIFILRVQGALRHSVMHIQMLNTEAHSLLHPLSYYWLVRLPIPMIVQQQGLNIL